MSTNIKINLFYWFEPSIIFYMKELAGRPVIDCRAKARDWVKLAMHNHFLI